MAIHERKRAGRQASSTRSSSTSAGWRRSHGRLNRFERVDEKPFEAVAKLSEFNQSAYELFAQPLVQSLANEAAAEVAREFHPLRVQRWAISDLNPWLAWLPAAADAVKAQRKPVGAGQPCAQGRALHVRGDQRVARLLPRDPRRDQRGGVLPDLRQRVLALPRRRARGRQDRSGSHRPSPRAAGRQGCAGRDRRGRLSGSAGAHGVAARRARARRCRWSASR